MRKRPRPHRLNPEEFPPAPYPGTKWIALTKGKLALVDEADHEWLSQHLWSYVGVGYAVRGERVGGRQRYVYMHREIAQPGMDLEVDHRNRDKLDNRRSNLRVATSLGNKGNTKLLWSTNTSGYRGVRKRKDTGRWTAHISINDKQRSLGCFDTPEEATRAYDLAAIQHFGEFATLNFPVATEVSRGQARA